MKPWILFLTAVTSAAQTPVASFPAVPMPAAVAGFAEFNQLGTPRFTMGVSALYPVAGSVGVYGSTTADVLPKLSTDAATGKQFYALSASIRQGFHKSVITAGRWAFLLGGDVGPGFSSAQPTGINITLSSSFIATTVYQITPRFSTIVPVRMLYVSGAGWNPVIEMGLCVSLKGLTK